MTRWVGRLMVLAVATVFAACGGGSSVTDSGMMSGPGMMTGPGMSSSAVTLMGVAPAAGATGVTLGSAMSFRFNGPIHAGMEQYVDLHVGDLAGPLVAIACALSADRTELTCTPNSPLAPRTTYALHLGGGMMGASGAAVDYTYGPGMGGQWVSGGMMTGTHGGGMSWGMMGNGWRHANGSYGMVFTFTTE